jgi:predicted DNA-binding transcriptional regulator AlpA
MDEIDRASPEELARIIAFHEGEKARAWARLMAPREIAPKAPDRTINAREVGVLLGMGKDWVYAHADEIPGSWRRGKVLRFSASAVEAWKREGLGVRGSKK